MSFRRVSRSSFACAALLGATGVAHAQTNLIQDATIVAATGRSVPDFNGTPLPVEIFDGGAPAPTFNNPTISETGDLFFRAHINPTPNPGEWAVFHGSSPSNLKMVLRQGDAVPGVPGATFLTMNQFTAQSPDGTLLFSATTTGGGVTTADDSVFLVGTPGTMTTVLREGSAAPGIPGALLGGLSGSLFSTGINRTGRIYFKVTVNGGGVATTNDEAWYAGPPNALELVLREGQIVDNAAASILGTGLAQMNDAGQFVVQCGLSTVAGSAPVPATAANDQISLIYTPGSGLAKIVREGDVAPGTGGAVYTGLPSFGANDFSTSGRMAFVIALTGGDVVGTTNEQAIFTHHAGVNTLAVREGQLAPGTAGAEYVSFTATTVRAHDDGAIAIGATLRNGDVVGTTNNEAYFSGQPGSLKKVMRKGEIAPGTNGALFGSINPGPYYRTDSGRIVFANTLVSNGAGSLSGKGWFYYDPTLNEILPIWVPNEVLVVDGTPQTITDFQTYGVLNNTDGASLPYSHDGELVGVLTFFSGASAVVKVRTRAPEPVPYCSGDGTAAACPCGNAGTSGRGCGNNIFPSGALLTGAGSLKLSNDTLVLTCTGMPNGAMIFYQGPTQQSGGAGIAFGDGLRCINPTGVRRFKTKTVAGNTASYPQVGDTAITVAGAIGAPGTFYYQGWYRSANPSFCTSATFNLSNGVGVTWTP